MSACRANFTKFIKFNTGYIYFNFVFEDHSNGTFGPLGRENQNTKYVEWVFFSVLSGYQSFAYTILVEN